MPKLTIKTTTDKTHTIAIAKSEILKLAEQLVGEIPLSAEVFVEVPGGGDWSNTDLDIDGERPVLVRWTEVTHDG